MNAVKRRRNPRGWRNEDPEQRVGGGGVQPKAEKKKVTSPILMAEVVIDVLRMILLEFMMCSSRCSYCISCCREQENILNSLASLKLM